MNSNMSFSLSCIPVIPSHTVIQAHAASMEKVLKSISSEGRDTDRDTDRDRALKRSASLPQVTTFRSSLRRFLTRSNSLSPPPPTKSSRWSGGGGKMAGSASDADGSQVQRGGMSVLLMSQELHLEGNQQDFLKRFTATQASAAVYLYLCLCSCGCTGAASSPICQRVSSCACPSMVCSIVCGST